MAGRLLLVAAGAIATASCAHIPGTDVPIPPRYHEGYELSVCMPSAVTRDEACCGYATKHKALVICTEDGGDTWHVERQEDQIVAPDYGESP